MRPSFIRNCFEFLLTLFIPSLYFLSIFLILKTQTAVGFGSLFLGVLGVFFSYLGIFLWAGGFLSLGKKNLTVLPEAKTLIKSGVYRYFRHPIYLGITLTLFGLALSLGSTIGILYITLIVVPLNIIRAKKEEKALTSQFGSDYLKYKAKKLF